MSDRTIQSLVELAMSNPNKDPHFEAKLATFRANVRAEPFVAELEEIGPEDVKRAMTLGVTLYQAGRDVVDLVKDLRKRS